MKKQLFSIFALLCMTVASAWAQSTTRTPFKAPGENQLTVCDGTASNQYVPFDGYNADAAQHNQMIFPATDLAALSGKLITQITFYIDTDASNGSYTAADRLGTWTVSLGETEATTLSALDDSTPLTPVYQGYFDCSTGTLTLPLDEEYVYQGGNLLLDITHAAAGYNRWYFLGVEATGASYTRGSQRNFLPKTTFSYSEAPTCPKPSGFSVADITQTAATLSWTEKGTATQWQICMNGDETNPIAANSNPFTLTGLTPGTAYTASVRAVSGSNYSYWTAAANFKTQPLRTLGDIPAGWTVLADGQPVTVTDGVAQFFDGAKIKLVPPTAYAAKVKSVTTKDEPYSVPLTLEALTAGTVRVNSPKAGMQYTLNNGAKTAMSGTTTINVAAGDKVAFYGNGTAINIYQGTSIYGGSAEVKVYGNIMSLVDEDDFATATELTSTYTFRSFFNYNNKLKDASGLLLPATTLTQSCYYGMFQSCSALTAAPALPATTMAASCYFFMFMGCNALTAAPELPATTLAESCYSFMFADCSNLTAAPALPAETLAESCYSYMFSGCSNLTAAPALPATELAIGCYGNMFYGCSGLTSAPTLPAETLAESCYSSMFSGCSNLTAAPALPATTMAGYCYNGMFSSCTSLTAAPALPAETLAPNCYSSMFSGCSALTTAPVLPATTMAGYCYNGMFQGCTALTAAPALPATTMAGYCYNGMFQGCTALTTAPALPAKTLASNCYQNMFKGCTALTTAPALPATTMVYNCYSSMFENCTALTASPVLPATQLANGCYGAMFRGCRNLGTVTALAASSSGNTNNWLYNAGTNVTGTKYFITPSTSNWLTNSTSGIPSGWTRQNYVE